MIIIIITLFDRLDSISMHKEEKEDMDNLCCTDSMYEGYLIVDVGIILCVIADV